MARTPRARDRLDRHPVCIPSQDLETFGDVVEIGVEDGPVDGQRERRRGVTEDGLDGLRGRARADHPGCCGVPETRSLPAAVRLGPIRAGDLRDELYRVALDQGLARDAAFVAIGATDVGSLDDRGCRDAQFAAGPVEGRLHLAAYALGAAASGMTFLDSEIPVLLGGPLDGLLLTCVGTAEYRSTPSGPPGAPRAVSQPDGREWTAGRPHWPY